MNTMLNLEGVPYREANAKIRSLVEAGKREISLDGVMAQRYLGTGLGEGVRIRINGIPGNDLACYMDGAEIEVFDDCQDQVANTMNKGRVIVHGRCGDAAGYSMRGGELFVRDGVGWRVGIHMKEYNRHKPVIVIGGDAGAFLGEYMAGGIILLMGRPGSYLGSGMHGGVMYLRNALDPDQVPQGLVQEPCDEDDAALVDSLISRYNSYFKTYKSQNGRLYNKLRPERSDLYDKLYASS